MIREVEKNREKEKGSYRGATTVRTLHFIIHKKQSRSPGRTMVV